MILPRSWRPEACLAYHGSLEHHKHYVSPPKNNHNNQQAGKLIAKQADRAKLVEEAAWRVINSKLLDEQQKAIFDLRRTLEAA